MLKLRSIYQRVRCTGRNKDGWIDVSVNSAGRLRVLVYSKYGYNIASADFDEIVGES